MHSRARFFKSAYVTSQTVSTITALLSCLPWRLNLDQCLLSFVILHLCGMKRSYDQAGYCKSASNGRKAAILSNYLLMSLGVLVTDDSLERVMVASVFLSSMTFCFLSLRANYKVMASELRQIETKQLKLKPLKTKIKYSYCVR